MVVVLANRRRGEPDPARRAAEAAQLDGVQAMWDRFQTTLSQERESYARLEESRKALVRLVACHP